MKRYFSMLFGLRRKFSRVRITCSSVVWTRAGSSPRSPKISRSASVKAASLLRTGSRSKSTPVGKPSIRARIFSLASANLLFSKTAARLTRSRNLATVAWSINSRLIRITVSSPSRDTLYMPSTSVVC